MVRLPGMDRVVQPGLSNQVCSTRFVRSSLTIHKRPPTSDDHNFFVQTPFWVFLDFMENLLNQDSNNVPVEDSG